MSQETDRILLNPGGEKKKGEYIDEKLIQFFESISQQ